MRLTRWTVLAGCAVLIAIGLLAHAGQLTPPAGPVAPTMKTLDQISTQISSPQVATGAAPIKQVVRGVIEFAQGELEKAQTFSPSVDPAKSVVTLSNYCSIETPTTAAGWAARSSTCLMGLTHTQITVRVDASIAVMAAKVSYQIVEYN